MLFSDDVRDGCKFTASLCHSFRLILAAAHRAQRVSSSDQTAQSELSLQTYAINRRKPEHSGCGCIQFEKMLWFDGIIGVSLRQTSVFQLQFAAISPGAKAIGA